MFFLKLSLLCSLLYLGLNIEMATDHFHVVLMETSKSKNKEI